MSFPIGHQQTVQIELKSFWQKESQQLNRHAAKKSLVCWGGFPGVGLRCFCGTSRLPKEILARSFAGFFIFVNVLFAVIVLVCSVAFVIVFFFFWSLAILVWSYGSKKKSSNHKKPKSISFLHTKKIIIYIYIY